MKNKQLLELISSGEGLNMEFKESKSKLNKDIFDTVCAFLNRNGGHLFLGIKDDGTIIGIDKDAIDRIKKDFVTSLNNSNKINPTAYVSIEEIEIEGRVQAYI